MLKLLFVALIPLGLAGCMSFHDDAPAPQHTTVVVPAGSTVTCTNGPAGAC